MINFSDTEVRQKKSILFNATGSFSLCKIIILKILGMWLKLYFTYHCVFGFW